MNAQGKERITTAVDALVAKKVQPTAIALSAKTAAMFAIHGTHVDLDSKTLHADAAATVAELTHPDYNPDPSTGKGRPVDAAEAAKLGAERDHSKYRRPIVLTVKIDESITEGKFRVSGSVEHAEEV